MGVKEEIDAFWKEFYGFYEKNDITSAANMYCKNATMAFEKSPIICGKEAIVKLLGEWWGTFEVVSDDTKEIIELAPDAAVKIGVFNGKNKKDGKPVEFWYVTTLKKCDGKWHILIDSGASTKACCDA